MSLKVLGWLCWREQRERKVQQLELLWLQLWLVQQCLEHIASSLQILFFNKNRRDQIQKECVQSFILLQTLPDTQVVAPAQP